MATGADEVRVDHPAAALGVGEHEPRPALPAVEGAFEVVVVGLSLLPGGLMSGGDGLHPIPDLGGDQGFVHPVVAGPAEGHVALVVRVGEHRVC